jgi:hypothetical protein
MLNSKKKLLSTIALLLTISMIFPFAFQSPASAHTPTWVIPSFAYVSVAPSPIGVGQTAQVYMWVDTPMPSAAVTNDIRRHGYQLIIVKPDGVTETHNWDVISDTTGIQFWSYTPDQIGNYTLKFSYAGETYTWSGTYQNDTMAPAKATTTFQVVQEQLPAPIGSYPLPTEYWTRPIEGQNTFWFAISSNWLNAPWIRSGTTVTGGAGYGRYQPDGTAPNSAHVMWTKALQFGGIVGGNDTNIPGETYYMGGSYNVRFSNAIVMQGNIYYQEAYGNGGGGGDYVAVNLQTGKELWRINATATGVSLVPSFGYLYAFDSGNQHGVLPNGLLIAPTTVTGLGTVWRGYDPRTGVLTSMNVSNVPSGTAQAATLAPSSASSVSVAGPSGELLIYALTNCGTTANPVYYLSQWNSSWVIGGGSTLTPVNWYSGNVPANCPITPGPSGTNTNWNGTTWVNSTVRAAQGYTATSTPAYDWNISIPRLSGSVAWNIFRDAYYNDMLIATQGSFGTGPRASGEGVNVTAISLKAPTYGQVMWSKYYAPAPNNVTRQIIAVDNVARTFVTEDKETLQLTGFSLTDGSQIWTAQPLVTEWDTVRRDTLSAYGRLYAAGFDGILYCYDDKTGDLLWTYGSGGAGNSTYEGLGTAYGHMPIFVDVIADGKVILGTTEHSPGSPWYKDSRYRAINATDGTEIWTLTGWGTGMYVGQYDIAADGYFLFLNCYDMQVYSIGKGPSAMTITASPKVSTFGSSVIIEGTVTDIAAGTKQNEQAARFPYGVPAVSDASMKDWMEYVYMQKPRPTDATGVPVTLSVVDANGNYREIGKVTSDSDGSYSLNWKPDIEGKYTVYASFAGSESYWPSHSVTTFAIDPAAPTPAPTQEQITSSAADTYILPGIVAIIAAIAIGFAITILVLRKRP